jgi:ATP-dependent RNA/DNA helicase IGHMBP2
VTNLIVCRLKAALVEDGLSQIEVSTVDGFQGREKEIIVISMVRSNALGEVGFLADQRRMNVAVTRAKRRCVLICDTDTVTKRDKFLAGLIKYFEAHGAHRSAEGLVAH